ncbi:outer membrane protein [Methylosinus sp. Sm6]|uniref:outer membrane protein n=1 Tax=Methylosinus sp. Sm6 TaxID=2866948 RepID=UPI001C9A143D|nr:outer membrane beta-barrel protein [Methylosinus sp. Sm6]MBY6240238.1 outer membrane beta-barrel protein [Methylosinus sp. Sm6]
MRFSLAAATLALAVSAGSALAADLPSKKAAPLLPPPPPPPLWTGFYVGLNAGYTWDERGNVLVNSPASIWAVGVSGSGVASPSSDGFIGGGQIGYNYQFGQTFVVGVEADIQGIGSSGNTATRTNFLTPVTSTISASKQLDYLGTVRGRLGYLVTPTLLVYGTGGLAYGQTNLSATVSQSAPGGAVGSSSVSFSDTRVGWTAGGGVEWLFLPQWSAKVEYLYYDLGRTSASSPLTFQGGQVGFTTVSSQFKGHVVRAGVNYHFNLFSPPAAPVVAKY